MSTPTTNFGLTKPGVNDPVDQDQWGYQLNGDLDTIDTLLFQLSTTAFGPTPPSYAKPGTLWVDNSGNPWVLKIYDGTDFVTIGTIDPTNNSFNPVNGTPLTHKGDLLTSDGTMQTVLPVGSDGQVLLADSTATNGIKWGAGGGGGLWTTITKSNPTILGSLSVVDPELQLNMLANTTYTIEITAYFYNGDNTTKGFTYTFSGPASPMKVSHYSAFYGRGNTDYSIQPYIANNYATSNVTNNYRLQNVGSLNVGTLTMSMVIQNGVNNGSFNLTWNPVNVVGFPTNLQVLKGSFLRYIIT